MANRHLARTIAMQTLFCWDFNGQKDKLEDLVKESFQQFANRIAEMLQDPERFKELYPYLKKVGYR